jgi:hypothetical protein
MNAIEVDHAQPVRGGPVQLTRRHPLISYFVIANAFT